MPNQSEMEAFTRGRHWEISEYKRHLIEHNPQIGGLCSWCKMEIEAGRVAPVQEALCGTADVGTSTNEDTLPIAKTASPSEELPLLPESEWNHLTAESQKKLRKWFQLASEHLQVILDEHQTKIVDIQWVEDSLKFAGEGRTNTIKPDLLANLFNRVLKQAQERAYEAGVTAEHKSHGDFEGELYATLVDPVAEGQIKEAEMRKQLIESARWYRQHVYDMENQVNKFVANVRGTIEGWEKLAKDWNDEDQKQFDGPPVLYLDSVRVMVLRNCIKALKAVMR